MSDSRIDRNVLTVSDNRTRRSYELTIEDGAIRADDLRQIELGDGEGLVSYDPGFANGVLPERDHIYRW